MKKLGKTVNCEECGVPVYLTPGRILKNKHHTCSTVCAGKLASKLHSKKVKINCVVCNKDIYYKKSHFKNIKYHTCSSLCRSVIMAKTYLGVDNPKALKLNKEDRFFWDKCKSVERRAKIKGIAFDLDYIFLKNLYYKQNGKCFYSGIEMRLETTKKSKAGYSGCDYDVLSLDRRNSDDGYVKENVVYCLNCLNMLKSNHSLTDMQRVFRAINIKENSAGLKCSVKKLYEDAKLPSKGRVGDAGCDLYTHRIEDCGKYVKVYTGIAIEPNLGTYFMLVPRSSTYKKNITLYNNIGIIDNTYRGEITAIFLKTEGYTGLEVGDRLLQLIPQKQIDITFELVDQLSDTNRGVNGFGSSGY